MVKTYNDLYIRIRRALRAAGVEASSLEARLLLAHAAGKTVEKLLDIDLPDEMIEKVVEGVKAKIKVDDVKGILDGVKGLFGK